MAGVPPKEAKGTDSRASDRQAAVQIQTLIKGIKVRRIRSRQKHFLQNFLDYYLKHKPDISRRDAKFLLYGDSEYKGLLETCGNTNVKTLMSLKRSSILALHIVYTLMTREKNKNRFRNLMAEAPSLQVFINMKLQRHINKFEREKAFNIISVILEKNPTQNVYDILGKNPGAKEAAQQYVNWDLRRMEIQKDKEKRERKRVPKRWAEVREEELELDPSDDDERGLTQEANDSSSDDEVTDPLDLLNEKEIRVILFGRAKAEMKDGNLPSAHGSIQTCRPDFNPDVFLATMHRDQDVRELENGLENLERNVKNRLLHMRQLVKQHFDQFVSCKTIIDGIHDHLKKELMNRGMGPSRTALLDNAFRTMQRTADGLYKPLLERKQRTDRIRSALEVLKRFRFFFSLPGALKQSIKQAQYAEAVRLYERSKSYKLAKGVPILQSVQTAVLRIVSKLRQSLLKKLENPHAPFEEHQHMIGFLEKFDCGIDPTWYYLTHRADCIVNMLERWFKTFRRQTSFRSGSTRSGISRRSGRSKRIPTDDEKKAALGVSDTPNVPKVTLTRPKPDGLPKSGHPDRAERSDSKASVEEEVEYSSDLAAQLVAKMVDYLSEHLPDLFKLSVKIGDGARPPPSAFAATIAAGANASMAASPSVLRMPPPITSPAPIVEEGEENVETDTVGRVGVRSAVSQATTVKELFDCVQATFTRIARRCIFPPGSKFRQDSRTRKIDTKPLEVDPKRLASLHRNVVAVTQEFNSLERLGASELFTGLEALANDAVEFFITCTFKSALITVRELEFQEDWSAHRTITTITRLPTKFQSAVDVALDALKDATPVRKPTWMVQLVVSPFTECLRVMADVLHVLAFPHTADPPPGVKHPSRSSKMRGNSHRGEARTASIRGQNRHGMNNNRFAEEEARKVLVVLANTMHVVNVVLPHLWDKCRSIVPEQYHKALTAERKDINTLYLTLSEMVENAYIRTTALGLSDFVTRGITTSGRDWMEPHPVTKVREYVLELLLDTVLVYDDLLSISKDFVAGCMQELLIMLADNFYNLVRGVGRFCASGAMQVVVEIDFIQKVLVAFQTSESQGAFRSARSYLYRFIGPNARQSFSGGQAHGQKIVQKTLQTTKVMFACFESQPGRPIEQKYE
ncbi:hypothetical protein AAMO2058_000994100 [Amorphochlora amoebiformis]